MPSPSVADELFFEQWLDSLPPDTRRGVDSVLRSGGYKTGYTWMDMEESRSQGYQNGYAKGVKDGRAEKKTA